MKGKCEVCGGSDELAFEPQMFAGKMMCEGCANGTLEGLLKTDAAWLVDEVVRLRTDLAEAKSMAVDAAVAYLSGLDIELDAGSVKGLREAVEAA